MTRQERDRIRHQIDQTVRQRIREHEARLHRAQSVRRKTSAQRYYWKHRTRILAARAARKEAA